MKKFLALAVVCLGLAGCSSPVDPERTDVIYGKDSIGILDATLGDCRIYNVYRAYKNNGVVYSYPGRVSQISLCKGQGRNTTNNYQSGKTTQENHTIFEENL